jgi:PAS domain S-box-containing protein
VEAVRATELETVMTLPDERGRRKRAEERLAGALAPDATDSDARRLVHDLQVHQLELEMQNDELQEARLEAEDARHRYAELFDFAPIGYFHVAVDGTLRAANFAGARLLASPRAELVGLALAAFVAGDDRPRFERFLATVLTGEGGESAHVGEFALSYPAAEGSLFVRVTGGPLAGPTPSALLAVEDVTARRHAEESLREEARRKDDFLAALSHELRNPLAPIRNGVLLLQRSPHETDRAQTAVAVIDRQATHLTRIVDDLLDVTRIAHGKVRLRRERLELGAHVQRTVEDNREAFEKGGVRLEWLSAAEPCWVDADASRLAQVLGNLLANALKFTNRGGRVEVRLRRERATAALSVRDSGIGIDAKVLARIFEPFVQAPQTLDRSTGGLGLGLATVKGLVELHGGTVEAASDGPGRGAAFTVRIPLAPAPAARAAPCPAAPGRQRRVLVIDDNEDAATSLRDVLELSGHEVRVALDGASGLAAARELRPEIVICDIGLPGMDGYAVARALREDPELRAVWLVALSGYAGAEDVLRALEAGFDRHLAKPTTVTALEAIVAEAPAPGTTRAD